MSCKLVRAVLAAPLVVLAQVAPQSQVAHAESPYSLDVTYTGEVWRNTHGGIRTGSSYLDNLDVQLTVDGEKAWGVPGLTVFGYLLHNNGGTVSEDLVGDAQAISNIEALDHTRVYELWAEWAFGAERSDSLRVGLYDLNSEFDATEVGALFTQSGHGIGTQIGQTGLNGPSIFPVTSLAARLKWQPAQAWTVLLAALDGVPGDPEHPSSNRVRLGGDDGWLLAAEVAWEGERWRKIALGGWRYTSRFEDQLTTDAFGDPVFRRGNDGVYALAEINLWNSAGGPRSLDAYARYGTADGRVNRFDEAWALGVVSTGPFAARPQDQLGIAVSVPTNGDAYREVSALAGERVDSSEYAFELTYRTQVTDWLVLQPTVHHIVNPDTVSAREDALAVALRFELAWGKSW
jgi:porin